MFLANAVKLCYNGGMERVQVNAHAKLNLTLEVTGREGNFHTLDSLVCALDLADTVTAQRRTDGRIAVQMHGMGCEGLPPESNVAVRAAEAFFAAFPAGGAVNGAESARGAFSWGADIDIEKHIPVGGGLGGSSADGAGVLLALGALYGVPREALFLLASGLGSDTAAQLTCGFQRMRGRGERLARLTGLPKLYFVLLCPEGGVSSADCYRKFDALGGASCCRGATERAIAALAAGELTAGAFSNDLLTAACALNGEISEAMAAARALFPLAAGMTGSGSTVFALFLERAARDRALLLAKTGKFTALAAETIDI